MKKRTASVLLAAILALTTILGGCKATEEKPIEGEIVDIKLGSELTERQKVILKKMHLPQDYDKLTLIQQDKIRRIEVALRYIENKHPEDEFEYAGYSGSDHFSGSMPCVVVNSKIIGEKRTVNISISLMKDGRYVCEDDYSAMLESDSYVEEVRKFVALKYPYAKIFAYGYIDDYEEGDEYIMARASGIVKVVINNVLDEEEVKELLGDMAEWANSYNNDAKYFAIVVLSDEDFENANEENVFSVFVKDDRDICHHDCTVDKMGNVNVY